MTETQIAAMDDFADSDHFNDQEKAVLKYAEQLTATANVDADVVATVKGFLTESQLVVLAGAVGLANFTSRFNHAFDVELP